MEELLRSLGRLAGIIVGTKKIVEDSVRDALFSIARSVGGDVLLRIIYSFPQPDNNILKELSSLGLDNDTLHELCGERVTIDCLFSIVEILQKEKPTETSNKLESDKATLM